MKYITKSNYIMSSTRCIHLFIDVNFSCEEEYRKLSNNIGQNDIILYYPELRYGNKLNIFSLIGFSTFILSNIIIWTIEDSSTRNVVFLYCNIVWIFILYKLYSLYQNQWYESESLLSNIYTDIRGNMHTSNNILCFHGPNKVAIGKIVDMIKKIGFPKDQFVPYREINLKIKAYKENNLNLEKDDEKYFYLSDSNIIID